MDTCFHYWYVYTHNTHKLTSIFWKISNLNISVATFFFTLSLVLFSYFSVVSLSLFTLSFLYHFSNLVFFGHLTLPLKL